MRLWLAVILAQPEPNVVVEVAPVPQPAPFGDVETGGATGGVEFAGVTDGSEEFRDDKSFWRLLDVFAKAPPAKIVNLLDLAVGALEERDVLLQPAPGFLVGDGGCDNFVV